jgi:hypothetical protein
MTPETRNAIERACARLVWQYAYLNDERRFAELANLFTEDGRLYRPSAPSRAICGRPSILAAFEARPLGTLTFHVCTDVVIDVSSPTQASGRSRILQLSATRDAEGCAVDSETRPLLPGTFDDDFILTDAGWRFAQRRGSFWI